MYTGKEFFRDILLFSVLSFFILCAHKRIQTFIALHKHSMIHELDRSFVDQVYAMQRHIRILMELMEQGCIDDTCLEKVRQMQKNVEIIESKYTKNSPGLLLLGPIGTTSIVVKEQQLARRLLQYVNEMNQILNQMAQVYGLQGVIDRGPIASVELGLQHNSALLASIRHAKQKLSAEAKKEIKQFEKAA